MSSRRHSNRLVGGIGLAGDLRQRSGDVVRIVAGFLAAPLLNAALFYVCIIAVEFTTVGRAVASGFATTALILSYVGLAIFGLPSLFVFRKRGWYRWWQVTSWGAVCAATPFLIWFGAPIIRVAWYAASNPGTIPPEYWRSLPLALLFWGVLPALNGASVGFWLWLIGVWRNDWAAASTR